MRGALRPGGPCAWPGRIIPADAGSTDIRGPGQAPIADHPRRCGEHSVERSWDERYWGSSPQMRGAPDAEGALRRALRIIPADAGSTIACRCAASTAKDHPRRCGEHMTAAPVTSLHSGSSPQMRGALIADNVRSGGARIIPADAGSTWLRSAAPRRSGDHPRRCGEHCNGQND